jgi:tetratricopeptide (TPR) repeat protein
MSLFLFFLNALNAQEKLNYMSVDKQSYELFQNKKWPELIQFSEKVRRNGIDFFFLQVRTGIALYNEKKYRKATDFFLQAYSNDQSFEWLQEYIYYSLFYSGRYPEAIKYASLFSNAVQEKIGFKNSGVTRLAYEGGFSSNPDFDQQKTRDFSREVDLGNDYGSGYFLKNYSFHSFDLSHKISPKLTLNHNITNLSVNREAVLNWGGQSSSPVKINQFQYFINPVWTIGKKLNISSSLNLTFGSGDLYSGWLNRDSSKYFILSSTKYTDAVFSTAVWSNFGNFAPGFEINAGDVNGSTFAQVSAWITYYPLSNAKLYLTPRIYFKTGTGANSSGYNALGLSGGVQLWKVHLNGQYLFGDMENFVESAGYVISNFPGKSDRKITGSLYFPLGKKSQVVFRYINQNVLEEYQVYTDGIKTKSLEYNYLKQTITTGISWNF